MPKKAGDEVSGELLAKGYWRVLGEKLSEHEMSTLTEMVLERCKWFPTVAECREIMGEQSYSNPFYVTRRNAELQRHGYVDAPRLAAPAQRIEAAVADETRSGLAEGESLVPATPGCAQNDTLPTDTAA